MPDDGTLLLLARRYYRRLCTVSGALDLARLRSLADEAAGTAFEETLITSNTFEGGSAQSVLKFPAAIRLLALEDLIAEADTSLPREVTSTQATFR